MVSQQISNRWAKIFSFLPGLLSEQLNVFQYRIRIGNVLIKIGNVLIKI